MTHQIYTATGCARCRITKRYMQENDISYEEFDFKADGREAFSQFYRSHRKEIFRDKDGVEFPVFTDGRAICQGVSVIVGYLIGGGDLSGFIGRSALHGEWIDGFDISGGHPDHTDKFLRVLTFLKQNSLKIQVTTDGRNASVLEAVYDKKLADRVLMEVRGTAALYKSLVGVAIDEDELKQSVALTARFEDYRFSTTIAPMTREDGTLAYLAPEVVGDTAKLIEEATGSKKHPYQLKAFDPQKATDEKLKSIEPLPPGAMFKYRTSARRYMVMAEIQKNT